MMSVVPVETTITTVLLERNFKNKTAHLTEAGLHIERKNNKEFIPISEIFACELVKQQRKCRSSRVTELLIHAYVIRAKSSASVCREKVLISLEFEGKNAVSSGKKWEQTIIKLSCNNKNSAKTRKFLVFINPNAGPGKAKQVFHETVEPMFKLAGIEYDVKVTERPLYAHDYVRDSESITTYSGVIACGGDGILYEIFNGLSERKDWKDVIGKLTFGIIPCGSGNGLVAAMSHNHKGDPLVTASLAIVRNNTSTMDLVKVETPSKTYHSFLSITWGYMADVDIRSEAIKSWAGNARFTIWAVKNLLFLQRYKAVVSYLPLGKSSLTSDKVPDIRSPITSNDWIHIDDEFVGITAAYQSHLSPELYIAPDAKLNDGIIWLLLFRSSISRYKFLDFLLKIEQGTHIPTEKDKDIQMIQCKAMRIVPKCDAGCIAVDGEEVDFGPIQATIIPSVATVFVPIMEPIQQQQHKTVNK